MKKTITNWLPEKWRRTAGAFMLSAMMGGVSNGQVLITENFSTGSGTTAPAGWTTAATSTTGTPVTWTFSGARSVTGGGTPGFVANYAIFDSDAGSATGEDGTLEGPTFDASQPGTYRLEYDNQFRGVTNTDGTPTVEVWNGTAWTAVLTMPGGTNDGYPNPANHKTIDITTAAGNSATAKVRFHWVNGSDDWWWAVDNVTITRINCTAPTATYTIVPNCGTNQFSVNVNITNMGSAASIAIKEGATTFTTATATGTYSAGPFASGSSHVLTLEHNANTLCNVTSPAQAYYCPPANDECATAIPVPVNTGTTCTSVISGTVAGATASTGPTSSCGTYDDDVWYSFVANGVVQTISLQNLAGSTTDLTFQVLSACGATTTLTCSDPQSATISGFIPGNTYFLRVASYTSTPNQTSTFDVCITTPPNMTYVSSTTTQASTSTVAAASTNQQILSTVVVTNGQNNPLSLTQIDYNTTGTTNTADITGAKVYYTGTSSTFSTTTPFGTVVANPNGTFSVVGSQTLAGGTSNTNNYFFLVYDVACAATAANVVDAQCTSVIVGGTPRTPTATNPAGTRAITGLLATNQPATSGVTGGSVDNQVLRVDVNPCGASGTVESLTFATTGSTNAATDIASAKVYYTTSTTFSNTIPYGTAVPNPNGTFTVTGSQNITAVGYFWLLYDLNCTATGTNVIDAAVTSVTMSGTSYTPATANPTGTRTITAATFTATTNQPSTAIVLNGSTDQQVLRVALTGCASSAVTDITFSTAGSTNVADITNAKVYFTPTTTFATTTPFGSPVANPNGTFTVTGNQVLGVTTGYFWLTYDIATGAIPTTDSVDASCVSAVVGGNTATPTTANPTGKRGIVAATANDLPAGALTLTMDAACSSTFSNVNSMLSANEPRLSCKGSQTTASQVWFKFVAPASGFVKISTDYASTALDSKIGLFTTSNPSDPTDLASFSIISCDDDGGVNGNSSAIYASDLIGGATYYVAVAHYNDASTGAFCIDAKEVTSAMISSTATSCTSAQATASYLPTYTGWVSIIDATGNIVANVRQNAGTATGFSSSLTVVTGAPRTDVNGQAYLNRNFLITPTGGVSTSADVKLFFTNAEVIGLAAPLANLNISKVDGSTCTANATGIFTLLPQASNGSANGISWIQANTTSFSNFFINGSTTPLPIRLNDFTGKNAGSVNNLDWETSSEVNFSHFELQRSADGTSYSKLATISSKGITTGSRYSYTDEHPVDGKNYYRLNMVDRDGKSAFSDIVVLVAQSGTGLAVHVHPNPVSQQLNVEITGTRDVNARIMVLDIAGKVLQTIPANNNIVSVDMSRLSSGIYMIRYTDNSHNTVIKVNKN